MPKQSKLEPFKKEVIACYQSGHSLSETAQKFNSSISSVSNFLRKNNVETRNLSEANLLSWTDQRKSEFSSSVTGRPSPAKGKTWQYNRVIKREKLKGSGNSQWQGGKTRLAYAIRGSNNYKVWRRAVFVRDNWECTICGAKSGTGKRITLHVDHIVPLSKLLSNYNIRTTEQSESCSVLWDITNGRTLCKNCHKETPTYGVNAKFYK